MFELPTFTKKDYSSKCKGRQARNCRVQVAGSKSFPAWKNNFYSLLRTYRPLEIHFYTSVVVIMLSLRQGKYYRSKSLKGN